MSSLEHVSYQTWKKSDNPIAVVLRDSLTESDMPKTTLLVWGVARNILECIGQVFMALTLSMWNAATGFKTNDIHWIQAQIYISFTLLCLKALKNYSSTINQLQLLAAKSCFHNHLQKNTEEIKCFNIHLDCKPEKINDDDLMPELSRLYHKMSEDDKTNFVMHMNNSMNSIQKSTEEFQLKLLTFLHSFPKSDAVTSFVNNLLELKFKEHGRILIIGKDDTVQFFSKEAFESLVDSFFHEDDFIPSLQEAKAQNFRDGLRFNESYDCQFLNQLESILQSSSTDKTKDTNRLLSNISFFHLLSKGKQKATTKDFINNACETWRKKILNGETLDEDQFQRLWEISNILTNKNLKTAMHLYYFAHYPLESYMTLHKDLDSNIPETIQLLFLDHKIQFTSTFLRILTYFIYKKSNEHICELCKNAAESRFVNNERGLTHSELMRHWNNYDALENLDTCLEIYKCHLTNQYASLQSGLETAIPELVFANAKAHKQFPEKCDEILELAIDNIPLSPLNKDKLVRIFNHLSLAHEKGFKKLKIVCIKKILAAITGIVGPELISEAANTQQLNIFFLSLKELLTVNDNNEGSSKDLALFQFAKQKFEKGEIEKTQYDQCITFLKAKKYDALSAVQDPDEKLFYQALGILK